MIEVEVDVRDCVVGSGRSLMILTESMKTGCQDTTPTVNPRPQQPVSAENRAVRDNLRSL